MSQSSPEYDTLVQCTTDLITALRADPLTVADKLQSCGFISHEVYQRMLTLGRDNSDKVRELVLCVKDQVELEPQKYHQFLEILNGESWLETIAKKLCDTYGQCVQLVHHHSPQLDHYENEGQQLAKDDIRTISESGNVQSCGKRSIQEEIDKLQRKFHDLTMNTCVYLSSKEDEVPNFVTKFRMYITVLPGHIRKHYQASLFSKSKRAELKQSESIEEIFSILGDYWNYLNPSLLSVVVKKFGDLSLNEQIQQYEQDLHQFCSRTKVIEHPAWVHYPPHDFSEVVVKLKVDENECTIAQLFEFRSTIAQHSSIEPYSIGVKSGSPGCLCVTISLTRALTLLFVQTLDPDVLSEEEIVSIKVDGVNLLEYKHCLKDHYPLVEAAQRGYNELIATLMESGSDVNQQDEGGNTALIWASINGHHDVVISLLAASGINVNLQNKGGWTALIWACYYGHHDVVISLLAAPGININLQDEGGRTALIWTSHEGHHDVVISLLAVPGINFNLQDAPGLTALMWAIMKSNYDVILSLLTAPDINVNLPDIMFGDTALHKACHMGCNDVVQALVASPGIEVNIQNKVGVTPLMGAILRHCTQSALTMIATPGVDVNKVNKDGLTALIMATQQNNIQVVESLLKVEGVAIDIQEESAGWSALFFAAEKGYLEIVQLLLNAGADTTLRDKEGVTVLDVATVHEQKYVIAELEKHVNASQGVNTSEGATGIDQIEPNSVDGHEIEHSPVDSHTSDSKPSLTSRTTQTHQPSSITTTSKTLRDRVLHAGRSAAQAFNRLLEDTFLRSLREKADHLAAKQSSNLSESEQHGPAESELIIRPSPNF